MANSLEVRFADLTRQDQFGPLGTVALSHRQDRSPQGFLRDRLFAPIRQERNRQNLTVWAAGVVLANLVPREPPENLLSSRRRIAQCNRQRRTQPNLLTPPSTTAAAGAALRSCSPPNPTRPWAPC